MPNQKFQAWTEQILPDDTAGIIRAYESGYAGCVNDPAAAEELRQLTKDTSGFSSLSDAAHANGWAGSAAGKLVAHFTHVMDLWPNCWPGDAQTVGSCVSHGEKNGILYTLGCEITANRPDPITGKMEGKPFIPPEGILSGVLSPAPIYWCRGYSGHGWSCQSSGIVVVKRCGCVPAMNYEKLGVDLTNVTRSIECLYGSRQAPEAWQEEFAKHRLASIAEVNSFDEIRDALDNGYGINSCGSEGFSSTRDENGVSRRSGSWSHSMAYIGADDRPEIKSKYGEPLVLVQNSWGSGWIGGPRRILGTSIDIPQGSFWARWSDLKRRYAHAAANVNGWPRQRLPNWGMAL